MTSDRLEGVRRELRRARSSGRIHGADAFCGELGTGKREIALWFARLLLCRSTQEDPCGSCRSCRILATEAADPVHPDLQIVRPDGAFIRVEQIRMLQRGLSLVSNERGHRVVLIFEADRLRVEAANALLKTLEEPPDATTLVLVAERSNALLSTVRSRTTLVRFAPEAAARLIELLLADGLSEEAAWLAAEIGGGSHGAAREWADLNLEPALEMCEFLARVQEASVSEILDFAESFRGPTEKSRPRTELLLSVFDAVARRAAVAAADKRNHPGLVGWLDRIEAAASSRRELQRRNLNPQILVENLLLDLKEA